MVRFYWLIITCFPLIVYYIVKATHYAKHPEKYDDVTCYALAQQLITIIKKERQNYHEGIWCGKATQGGWICDVFQPSGEI